jgi:hypothetical protein
MFFKWYDSQGGLVDQNKTTNTGIVTVAPKKDVYQTFVDLSLLFKL